MMGQSDIPSGGELDAQNLTDENLESELWSSGREACVGYNAVGSALSQFPERRWRPPSMKRTERGTPET